MVRRLYELALDRIPGIEERSRWVNMLLQGKLTPASLVESITASPEAEVVRQRAHLLPQIPDGRFVQFVYEHFLQRSPVVFEIEHWSHNLRQQIVDRGKLALLLFSQHASKALSLDTPVPNNDPSLAPKMGGVNEFISGKLWLAAANALPDQVAPFAPKLYPSLKRVRRPEILVSIITSLYRGGRYIEQFMENMVSQTIFREHCELIIIDADSPEQEQAVISRYLPQFPNIVYHRASTRIGIYEAWNLGVGLARGSYLTNANLDDLRRSDSFERQLEIFEKFPFVDIVYQDFFYSFDDRASFDQAAAVNARSEVPIVTAYNLMQSNSPHNAPMWRRSLHDELGLFDASFRSAGDYDFWIRCVERGKVFFKVNDPHVVYYVNPTGLSTQPDTRGIDEGGQITKAHGLKLLSPLLLGSDDDFLNELGRVAGKQDTFGAVARDTMGWKYAAVQKALRECSAAGKRR